MLPKTRDTPLYRTWINMRARCSNPNAQFYSDYGGRGIGICPEWDSDFSAFYFWALAAGWQKGLHLDRIDNDGDYKPENCRFVTAAVNNANRRDTKKYEHRGSLWTATQLYEFYSPSVSLTAFKKRLTDGWTLLDAISFKKNERYKRNGF